MELGDFFERIKNEVQQDMQQQIRVAVFGQPGAGKSTLINSLLGVDVAPSGVGNDTTVEAKTYEYNGLSMVDLPGYDTARFPVGSYWQQFSLGSYDAFLCVFSGKIHAADCKLFRHLQEQGLGNVCLLVRTGLDLLFDKNKTIYQLRQEIEQDVATQLGQNRGVYFVSNRTSEGLTELANGLENILPDVKKEKFVRRIQINSLQMLQNKYSACEKLVSKYAWLAAANAVNPIPGLNVSLDLKIMNTLFDEIKQTYNLQEVQIDKYRGAIPVAERLLSMGTKEGLFALGKMYIGKQRVEAVARYIPYAGQAVAMGLGYVLTSNMGQRYLDACQELAHDILQQKLRSYK